MYMQRARRVVSHVYVVKLSALEVLNYEKRKNWIKTAIAHFLCQWDSLARYLQLTCGGLNFFQGSRGIPSSTTCKAPKLISIIRFSTSAVLNYTHQGPNLDWVPVLRLPWFFMSLGQLRKVRGHAEKLRHAPPDDDEQSHLDWLWKSISKGSDAPSKNKTPSYQHLLYTFPYLLGEEVAAVWCLEIRFFSILYP
jgi:hypothetical protein